MTSGATGAPWEQPHHDAGPAASRRSLCWFSGKRERLGTSLRSSLGGLRFARLWCGGLRFARPRLAVGVTTWHTDRSEEGAIHKHLWRWHWHEPCSAGSRGDCHLTIRTRHALCTALLAFSACASDGRLEHSDGSQGDVGALSGTSSSAAGDGGASASNHCAAFGCNAALPTSGAATGADGSTGTSAAQPESDDGNASSAGFLSDAEVGDQDVSGGGVCDSPAILASSAATGAACPSHTSDGCGGGQIVGLCGWDNRDCHRGMIWQSTSHRLDCDASAQFAPVQAGAAWGQCDTALQAGRTGEACGFAGSCARGTDDPCCVETASCGLLHQETRLYRYRVCMPGCEKVHADPAQASVVRCTGGDMTRLLGSPCEPGLVCIAGREPAQTGALSYYDSSVVFCANGVLVGNRNAFLPFL
jgi:hypothetical protein